MEQADLVFGVAVVDPGAAGLPRLAEDYPPAAAMRFDLAAGDPEARLLLPFVAAGALRPALEQAEAAFRERGYGPVHDVVGCDAAPYVRMGRVDAARVRGLAPGEVRPVGHPVLALLRPVPLPIWFRKALEGALFTPEALRDGLRVGVELTALRDPPPPALGGAAGAFAGGVATFLLHGTGAPVPDPGSWDAARADLLARPDDDAGAGPRPGGVGPREPRGPAPEADDAAAPRRETFAGCVAEGVAKLAVVGLLFGGAWLLLGRRAPPPAPADADGAAQDPAGLFLAHIQADRPDRAVPLVEWVSDPNGPPGAPSFLYQAACRGQVEVCRALLARRVDVDARSPQDRQTPLIGAALGGHAETLALLLDAGALADAASALGRTALCEAAFGGHLEAVELLVARGAAVDHADARGGTPLIFAAVRDHPRVIEALLRAGARADRTDASGYTALHVAALKGHGAAARALVAGGADRAARDGRGATAAELARDLGHAALAAELGHDGAAVGPPAEGPAHRLEVAPVGSPAGER